MVLLRNIEVFQKLRKRHYSVGETLKRCFFEVSSLLLSDVVIILCSPRLDCNLITPMQYIGSVGCCGMPLCSSCVVANCGPDTVHLIIKLD